MSSRQVMRRVDARRVGDAATVLDAMADYIGTWRSEDKTGPEGRAYRFGYDLHWLDADRTIAEVRVTRIRGDGRTELLWHGFKGREPDGEAVYYWGASPSGRAARGMVHLETESLVTLYDGWGAQGDPLQIKDVFTPVEGRRWVSRTYVRGPGETVWRQVNEDHWEPRG